jgi:YebC/PmpR family DNA-binding regulatory protein
MSGHSKWSTIKRKKAANDAKRGSLFTRLAREITIAARDGGGDADVNFNLRLAIDRAKTSNMPKDNIERAIKRGTGDLKEGAQLEKILYEAYAPHGVALLIEVVTDNRNRTVGDLRHILTKAGSNLADAGSVSWQFERMSYFALSSTRKDQDRIFDISVEAGADDVVLGDDDVEIMAQADAFKSINDGLMEAGFAPEEAGLRMIPNSTVELSEEQTLQLMKVIESIEDLDDVQQVFSNLEVSEGAVELLEAA